MALCIYVIKRQSKMFRWQNVIEMCKDNNRFAQNRLYEAFAGRMFRVCMRYVRDSQDAEEVLMNGFLKFFKSLPDFQYRDDPSLEAWLKRIMVNEALMHLRQQKNMPEFVSNDENQEAVSIALWQRMQAELQSAKKRPTEPLSSRASLSSRRRRDLYAAAITLLLLTAGIGLWQRFPQKKNELAAKHEVHPLVKTPIEIAKIEKKATKSLTPIMTKYLTTNSLCYSKTIINRTGGPAQGRDDARFFFAPSRPRGLKIIKDSFIQNQTVSNDEVLPPMPSEIVLDEEPTPIIAAVETPSIEIPPVEMASENIRVTKMSVTKAVKSKPQFKIVHANELADYQRTELAEIREKEAQKNGYIVVGWKQKNNASENNILTYLRNKNQ